MTTNRMAAGHLDGGDWVSRYLAANPPIPGWFSDEDVWLFSILDQLQVAAGVGRFTRDRRLPGQERSSSRLHAPTRRNSCCGRSLGQRESSDPENAGEQARLYPEVTFDRFKVNFQRFHARLPDMRRGISGQCLPGLDSAAISVYSRRWFARMGASKR